MAVSKRDRKRAIKRALRVKSHVKRGGFVLPRVSVHRSLTNTYAQVIDDSKHHTIASISTVGLEDKGDKKQQAYEAGLLLAKLAVAKGIERAVFDRGKCKYHGRLQFFADGLRAGGIAL